VIDGDTIDCSVDLGFFVSILCRFRLARINAPEIQTSSGKELKEKLLGLEGVDCRVESLGRDRYGRWVAEIFLNDRGNLSDWLLELGLVAHYV
jgi:endonuclease YncB( thermonuclease family)